MTSAIRVDHEVEMKTVQVLSDFSTKKWEIMKIDHHMLASVFADGFVETYNGASKYLKDQWSPSHVTQTLVCRVHFKKEYVENSILVKKGVPTLPLAAYKRRLDKKFYTFAEATHVVVGIVYGAEAYCGLSKQVNDNETEQARLEAEEYLSQISMKMQNALEAKQNLAKFMESFDNEEKHGLSRLKCRLYSDLQLNPVMECELFDAYKHCFELLNVSVIKSVPIEIELCPLKAIVGSTQHLEFGDAKIEVVNRFCDIWTEYERIIIKAKAFCPLAPAAHRPSIRQFVKIVLDYQQSRTVRFTDDLKRDRGLFYNYSTEADEKTWECNPRSNIFTPTSLNRWLVYKQADKEIGDKLTSMEGVVTVANKDKLELKLKNPSNEKFSLVLTIPPVDEETKKFLQKMKTKLAHSIKYVDVMYLRFQIDRHGTDRVEPELPWHTCPYKRRILDQFDVHVNRNGQHQSQFFIVFGYSSECSYSVYHAGNLLKGKFGQLPGPPTGLRVQTTRNGSMNVEWDFKDLGYPYHFLVEYRLKHSSDRSWIQQKTTNPGETKTTIPFESGSPMEIRVAADSCVGLGEFSHVLDTESSLGGDSSHSDQFFVPKKKRVD